MSYNRLRWLRVFVMVGLLVLVAGVFLLTGEPARAFNSYLTAAKAQYPTIVGTNLASCALCHVSSADLAFNPYGRAFSNASTSFTAIENRDSDGDGYGNLVEINAHTFPGDAGSKPAAAATATPTRVPPTATRTPTRTATRLPPTATVTQVPPTATATTTATETPPIATATATSEPPTPTATATEPLPTAEPTATTTATATPTVGMLPRLAVEVAADFDVLPASWIIRYTVIVTNASDIALPAIVVSDPLPERVYFVWALNGGELVEDEVIWRLLDVPAGETRVLYVHLWTNSTYRGEVNNVVSASAAGASVSAGRRVRVIGPPRD